MQERVIQLAAIIDKYSPLLQAVDEDTFRSKPIPTKWSRIEVLGHLVDSAQNNIRRFVVAQYETDPAIKYDQDKWVIAAGYQDYSITDLVQLWILLNKHICNLLQHMPAGNELRTTRTDQLRTIEWVAGDYNKHLLHHLHHLLNMEPIAYP